MICFVMPYTIKLYKFLIQLTYTLLHNIITWHESFLPCCFFPLCYMSSHICNSIHLNLDLSSVRREKKFSSHPYHVQASYLWWQSQVRDVSDFTNPDTWLFICVQIFDRAYFLDCCQLQNLEFPLCNATQKFALVDFVNKLTYIFNNFPKSSSLV